MWILVLTVVCCAAANAGTVQFETDTIEGLNVAHAFINGEYECTIYSCSLLDPNLTSNKSISDVETYVDTFEGLSWSVLTDPDIIANTLYQYLIEDFHFFAQVDAYTPHNGIFGMFPNERVYYSGYYNNSGVRTELTFSDLFPFGLLPTWDDQFPGSSSDIGYWVIGLMEDTMETAVASLSIPDYTMLDYDAMTQVYMDTSGSYVKDEIVWTYTDEVFEGRSYGESWFSDGVYYISLGSGLEGNPEAPEFPQGSLPVICTLLGSAFAMIRQIKIQMDKN